MADQTFKYRNYKLVRECYSVIVYWVHPPRLKRSDDVLLRCVYPQIKQAITAFKTTRTEIKKGEYSAGVRKFLLSARGYLRSSHQMKYLIKKGFFSKRELREGLKRWIHLNYIECL
jgi:hypothetical protein